MFKFEKINYAGNLTCCGSQALLTAFFTLDEIPDIRLFEAYTTVPFGIIHRNDDPHRLFTCYFDPDYGLDRALDSMGVVYETFFRNEDPDESEALDTLVTWCSDGPVVLGPLNMDGLRYLFHSELLYRMDHYIIVLGYNQGKFRICDPEGVNLAFINPDVLIKAWKGDTIPEGRGSFIMRRVIDKSNLVCNKDTYCKTIVHIADNMVKASGLKYGGANALRALAEKSGEIGEDPALLRRLTFDVPVRMQRCVFAKHFLVKASKELSCEKFALLGNEAAAIIDCQLAGYGRALNSMLSKKPDILKEFRSIAELENTVTDVYMAIRESVQ